MLKSTTIIAFDQHAATTVAAALLPGHRTPALHTLTSDSPTILRFVERVRRQGAVQCCYEAGPCGFELQRALTTHQVPCDIIAPALIPRRAGDRIKTDRRDAGQLAVLYRAGALTAIHIPTEQEEAARDLLRCREDIRADLLRALFRTFQRLPKYQVNDVHKTPVNSPRKLLCASLVEPSFVPNRSPMSIHFYSLTWRIERVRLVVQSQIKLSRATKWRLVMSDKPTTCHAEGRAFCGPKDLN